MCDFLDLGYRNAGLHYLGVQTRSKAVAQAGPQFCPVMHQCPWARHLASLNPSLTLLSKKIKSASFSSLPHFGEVALLLSEVMGLVLTSHLWSLPPLPSSSSFPVMVLF